MQETDLHLITTDRLYLPLFTEKNIEVDILRLDKIHPFVSGNKWFKLRYYLEAARTEGRKTILTFGGAWSNHIIATAAACQLNGFNSIGIIRGEEAAELSPVLQQAKEMGMCLYFLNREDYTHKKIPGMIAGNDHYIIPEGGYGIKGVEGAATIPGYFTTNDYTHICCAAGTGTMTAGLLQGVNSPTAIIAISVLKNHTGLEKNITDLSRGTVASLQVIHDYHFGGYAKYKPELTGFMNDFFSQTGIPSDFVYTAKTFFAVNDLAQKNFFAAGSRLLVIHSGGLQGNASFKKGTLIF
ncbi:MAG TPA: pyridoxal-phosphate dependent enzyme [Chitinophagaceae bacterium]|jgi:1-aminocyclopropane-1-carboxylate deaminase|nr:pyridoxal-phosphate dependent enzyme [Chitinophagaceae bacterium]